MSKADYCRFAVTGDAVCVAVLKKSVSAEPSNPLYSFVYKKIIDKRRKKMYRKSKSMFGKLLLLLLTLCCAIVLLFGLAACSETKGIASAVVNDNGELVITYTDGTSDNLGVVVGEKGDKGEQGEHGPQGDKG